MMSLGFEGSLSPARLTATILQNTIWDCAQQDGADAPKLVFCALVKSIDAETSVADKTAAIGAMPWRVVAGATVALPILYHVTLYRCATVTWTHPTQVDCVFGHLEDARLIGSAFK